MSANLIELYKKHEEGILYLIFGVLTTLVNWVSYAILVSLGLEINLSNILSWVIAVTFAFAVNKWFVFKSKALAPKIVIREMGSFFATRIITGAIGWILFPIAYALGMNQTLFGIDGFIAKIFTTRVETILNWAASKYLIFDPSKKEQNVE